jgi:hypothetical protein
MPMEIEKVKELLVPITLDHSPSKPDPAIQSIAMALLQMAEGIEELRRRLPVRADYF